MTAVVHAAVLICMAAGLIAGTATGLATGDGRLALRVATDFWLAAGLLKLVGAQDWSSVGGAAVVVVRRTAVMALGRSPGLTSAGGDRFVHRKDRPAVGDRPWCIGRAAGVSRYAYAKSG